MKDPIDLVKEKLVGADEKTTTTPQKGFVDPIIANPTKPNVRIEETAQKDKPTIAPKIVPPSPTKPSGS